jgi:cytochrome c biogenesis protein CcdA
MLDIGWWNGSSVWSAIATVDNKYYSIPSAILMIVGISTVLIEFLYPFLIIFSATRKYALIAIIIMHTGIAIVMGLHTFSAIMIMWNLAAFGNLAIKNKITNEAFA